MPERMSQERILLLRSFGAEVVLTPGTAERAGLEIRGQKIEYAAGKRELTALGKTATQAGSLNRAGYMRFDFTWGDAMSAATESQILRGSTPPEKAGRSTSSVARPRAVVRAIEANANRTAPATETRNGPGCIRT